MNLPIILDVALGLVFIFFVLSLLASELQEIISTLLQWRAEHLEKNPLKYCSLVTKETKKPLPRTWRMPFMIAPGFVA